MEPAPGIHAAIYVSRLTTAISLLCGLSEEDVQQLRARIAYQFTGNYRAFNDPVTLRRAISEALTTLAGTLDAAAWEKFQKV